MAGRYPKPDAERVTRHEREFGWTELPVDGREGDPPKLPARPQGAGSWSSQTKAAWSDLWSSPQATQWDQSGRTLHRWAVCHEDMVGHQADGNAVPASLLNEMRQIEDRHGLSPKAMMQLRWRITDDPSGDVPEKPKRQRKGRRESSLEVIQGGG